MRRLDWLLVGALLACAAPMQQRLATQGKGPSDAWFVTPMVLLDSHRPLSHPSWRANHHGLLYAGEVDNHLEVFWRSLTPGSPPKALTSSTTNNSEPQLSPNGRQVAWVSQQDDAKGDIWTMALDGSNKRRWTERATEDHAPCWLPDGKGLLYTAILPNLQSTIRQIDLASGADTLVLANGFDVSTDGDGSLLAYVRSNQQGIAKIHLHRLADGLDVPLSADEVAEGFPQLLQDGAGQWQLIYIRFVKDFAEPAFANAPEPTSIWQVRFTSENLAQGPWQPTPLTYGQRQILFVSATPSQLLYATRANNRYTLSILPRSGMLQPNLSLEQLDQASQQAEEPLLRQLAVRHLLRHDERNVRDQARYRLASLLAAQSYLPEAILTLQQLIEQAATKLLSIKANMAALRLAWQGQWQSSLAGARLEPEAVAVFAAQLKPFLPEQAAVPSVQLARCQLAWLQGQWQQAVACWQAVAGAGAGSEEGALAWLALAQVGGQLGQVGQVEQAVHQLFVQHGQERALLVQAVDCLFGAIAALPEGAGAAYVTGLLERYAQWPILASRSLWYLANLRSAQSAPAAVIPILQRLWQDYPSERLLGLQALQQLGQIAEQQQDLQLAQQVLAALQQVTGHGVAAQEQARQRVAHLALRQAKLADDAGQWEQAYVNYGTFLRQESAIVSAHRRYIQLACQLGRWSQVHAMYAAKQQQDPALAERYAYGLVLLYQAHGQVEPAQAIMQDVLARDMRFAAAHLTLGWIALYQEWHGQQKGGLEQAIERFSTARDLIDSQAEPELWAATHLNRGLALFHLGKHDSALIDLVARATMAVPFGNEAEEVTFWQHTALAAFYRDQLAVAIDSATYALQRCQAMQPCHRLASLAALLGGANLLAERAAPALQAYQLALQHMAKGDGRQLPLLRGIAMAHLQLGAVPEALTALQQALTILQQGGQGAVPAIGWLTTEIAANSQDISAAVYGFETLHEQAILHALQARSYGQLGQGQQELAALQQAIDRLALLRQQERQAGRLEEEWLYAQLALIHAQLVQGNYQAAWPLVAQGLELAQGKALPDLQWLLLQHGLAVWLCCPQVRPLIDLGRLLERSELLLALQEQPSAKQQQLRAWLVQAQHWSEPPSRPEMAASSPLASLQAEVDQLDEQLSERPLPLLAPLLQADGQVPPAWLVLVRTILEQPDGPLPAQVSVGHLFAEQRAQDMEQAIAAWLQAPPLAAHEQSEAVLLALVIPWLVQHQLWEQAWQVVERANKSQLWRQAKLAGMALPEPNTPLAAQVLQPNWDLLAPNQQLPWQQVQALLQAERAVLWQRLHIPQIGTWIIEHTASGIVFYPWSASATVLPLDWQGVSDQERDGLAVLYVDSGATDVAEGPWADWRAAWQQRHPTIAVVECLGATALVVADGLLPLRHDGIVNVPFPVASANSLAVKDETALATAGVSDLVPSAARVALMSSEQLLAGGALPRQLPVSRLLVVPCAAQPSPSERRAWLYQALLQGIGQVLLLPVVKGAPAIPPPALLAALSQFLPAGQALTPFGAELTLLGCYGAANGRYLKQANKILMAAAGTGTQLIRQAEQDNRPGLRQRARWELLRVLALLQLFEQGEIQQWVAEHPDGLLQRLLAKRQSYTQTMQRVLADNAFQQQAMAAYSYHTQALLRLLQQSDQQVAWLQLQQEFAHNLLERQELAAAIIQAQACSEQVAPELAKQYPQQVAKCYQILASAYQAQYAYEPAKQVLTAMATYLPVDGRLELAKLKDLQGKLAESQGLTEQIEANYREAIDLYGQQLQQEAKVEYWQQQQQVVLALARHYRKQGRYEDALVLLAGLGQNPLQLAGEPWQLLQLQQWLELSRIAWYQGQYQEAQHYQQQAYSLAEELDALEIQLEAASLAGLILFALGDLGPAAELFKDTLAASNTLPNQRERNLEAATQWSNLGMVYRQGGDLQQAMTCYEQAMQLDASEANLAGQAYDLRNIGLVWLEQDEYKLAQANLEKALALAKQVADNYNQLQIALALAKLYGQQQLGSDSAAWYLQAWQQALAQQALEGGLQAAHGLAVQMWQAGQIEQARGHFEQALVLAMQSERAASGVETGGQVREQVFADAIAFALALGEQEQVFRLIWQQQQRRLWDSLLSSQLPWSEQQRSLLTAWQAARRRHQQSTWAMWRGEQAQAQWLFTEQQLKQAEQQVLAQLGRLGPWLTTGSAEPPSLATLQRQLLPGEGILAAMVVGEALLLLLLDGDGAQLEWLAAGGAPVAASLEHIHRALAHIGPMEAELAQLGTSLLQPIWPKLQQLHHLYWLPSGVLHGAPLPALPVPGDQLLLDKLTLSVAPNWQWLTLFLAERANGGLGIEPAQRQGHGIGAVRALASNSLALPFAALEAQAVASLPEEVVLGPNRAQVQQGLQQLSNYGALAIAGHTIRTGPGPWDLAITLGTEQGSTIALVDLLTARLPPIVTFGACQTEPLAISEQQWLGFGVAALASGAQTAIGTLAPISDLAAGLLLKHFYRQLATNTPAQALTMAMQQLRRTYPHPAFWATLVLLGQPTSPLGGGAQQLQQR